MSLKPIVRSDGTPVMTWGAVNALLMCSLDANEAWEPNLSHIEKRPQLNLAAFENRRRRATK